MDTEGFVNVRAGIAAATALVGLGPDAVTLVAVSKGRSDDDVVSVARFGQTVFGENRQQGLAARIESGRFDTIEWHFIGPLQSNKVAPVAEHCSLLHSMDRMSLARKWSKACNVPVLIQFNLAAESQKSGFSPDEPNAVMDQLLELGLDVRGVMAIPPRSEDPEGSLKYFAKLRAIFEHYDERYANMEQCSMGMSNDYLAAISEGSTMVRVGRAIFGPALL